MKRKFLWIGIIGTLVVALIALALATTGDTREAAGRLDDLREEARKLGLPRDYSEVPVAQPIRPENNAALPIVQAAELLGKDDDQAITLLIDASRRPDCLFDIDLTDLKTEVEKLRVDSAISVLLAKTEQAFADKDTHQAQRLMHAATFLAKSLTYIPTPEAFQLSLEHERVVFDRLGDIMVANPEDDALMTLVQAETLRPRSLQSITYALRSFYAAGNDIGQNREIDADQRVTWMFRRTDFPADPWGREAVEARHLEGCIALHEDLSKITSWTDAIDRIDEHTKKWRQDRRASGYSLRVASTRLPQLARSAAENEAARRILFVAAGAFRTRIRDRAFPAKSPILGEMSFDPFTGTPMTYTNPGTGFYVYSVGHDGLDEGGPADLGLTVGGDISFRFTGASEP